jgi:hypothetical protein
VIEAAIAARRQIRVQKALQVAQRRLAEVQSQEARRAAERQAKEERELDFFRQLDESIAYADPSYVPPPLPPGFSQRPTRRNAYGESGSAMGSSNPSDNKASGLDPVAMQAALAAEAAAAEAEEAAQPPGFRTRSGVMYPRARPHGPITSPAGSPTSSRRRGAFSYVSEFELEKARAERLRVEARKRDEQDQARRRLEVGLANDDAALSNGDISDGEEQSPAADERRRRRRQRRAERELGFEGGLGTGLAPVNDQGAFDEYTPQLAAQLADEIHQLTLLDGKLRSGSNSPDGSSRGRSSPRASLVKMAPPRVLVEHHPNTLTPAEQASARVALIAASKRLKFLRAKAALTKGAGLTQALSSPGGTTGSSGASSGKSGMENRAEARELAELEAKLEGRINKNGDVLELSFLALAQGRDVAGFAADERNTAAALFRVQPLSSPRPSMFPDDELSSAQLGKLSGDSKFWMLRQKMARRRVLKYNAMAVLAEDAAAEEAARREEEEGAQEANAADDPHVQAARLRRQRQGLLTMRMRAESHVGASTAALGQSSTVKSYKRSAIQRVLDEEAKLRARERAVLNLGDGNSDSPVQGADPSTDSAAAVRRGSFGGGSHSHSAFASQVPGHGPDDVHFSRRHKTNQQLAQHPKPQMSASTEELLQALTMEAEKEQAERLGLQWSPAESDEDAAHVPDDAEQHAAELAAQAAASEAAAATAAEAAELEDEVEASTSSFDSRSPSDRTDFSEEEDENSDDSTRDTHSPPDFSPRDGDRYDNAGNLVERGPTPPEDREEEEEARTSHRKSRRRRKSSAKSESESPVTRSPSASSSSSSSSPGSDSSDGLAASADAVALGELRERKARLKALLSASDAEFALTGQMSSEARAQRKQQLADMRSIRTEERARRRQLRMARSGSGGGGGSEQEDALEAAEKEESKRVARRLGRLRRKQKAQTAAALKMSQRQAATDPSSDGGTSGDRKGSSPRFSRTPAPRGESLVSRSSASESETAQGNSDGPISPQAADTRARLDRRRARRAEHEMQKRKQAHLKAQLRLTAARLELTQRGSDSHPSRTDSASRRAHGQRAAHHRLNPSARGAANAAQAHASASAAFAESQAAPLTELQLALRAEREAQQALDAEIAAAQAAAAKLARKRARRDVRARKVLKAAAKRRGIGEPSRSPRTNAVSGGRMRGRATGAANDDAARQFRKRKDRMNTLVPNPLSLIYARMQSAFAGTLGSPASADADDDGVADHRGTFPLKGGISRPAALRLQMSRADLLPTSAPLPLGAGTLNPVSITFTAQVQEGGDVVVSGAQLSSSSAPALEMPGSAVGERSNNGTAVASTTPANMAESRSLAASRAIQRFFRRYRGFSTGERGRLERSRARRDAHEEHEASASRGVSPERGGMADNVRGRSRSRSPVRPSLLAGDRSEPTLSLRRSSSPQRARPRRGGGRAPAVSASMAALTNVPTVARSVAISAGAAELDKLLRAELRFVASNPALSQINAAGGERNGRDQPALGLGIGLSSGGEQQQEAKVEQPPSLRRAGSLLPPSWRSYRRVDSSPAAVAAAAMEREEAAIDAQVARLVPPRSATLAARTVAPAASAPVLPTSSLSSTVHWAPAASSSAASTGAPPPTKHVLGGGFAGASSGLVGAALVHQLQLHEEEKHHQVEPEIKQPQQQLQHPPTQHHAPSMPHSRAPSRRATAAQQAEGGGLLARSASQPSEESLQALSIGNLTRAASVASPTLPAQTGRTTARNSAPSAATHREWTAGGESSMRAAIAKVVRDTHQNVSSAAVVGGQLHRGHAVARSARLASSSGTLHGRSAAEDVLSQRAQGGSSTVRLPPRRRGVAFQAAGAVTANQTARFPQQQQQAAPAPSLGIIAFGV